MKDLISLLDKITSLTRELIDVLGEERAALSKQNIATLEAVIEKKLSIAQALQATDQQRDSILAKLGVAPGQAGIVATVEAHADRQLHDSWQALCEVSQRCKEDNLLVGTMIRKNQMATDQALQVLRQGSIATVQTYSSTGSTSRPPQSSPLGKA